MDASSAEGIEVTPVALRDTNEAKERRRGGAHSDIYGCAVARAMFRSNRHTRTNRRHQVHPRRSLNYRLWTPEMAIVSDLTNGELLAGQCVRRNF